MHDEHFIFEKFGMLQKFIKYLTNTTHRDIQIRSQLKIDIIAT
jgi:hypothetical protein